MKRVRSIQHSNLSPTRLVISEPLEGRRLFSTITVTSTSDTAVAGKTTLRDAITAASAATGATTIAFDSGVFATPQTITLGGNELVVQNSKAPITITGPSAGVTISGNAASRVFTIGQSTTASLSKITVTKGSAGYGGDIYNVGFLTLTNVAITGGAATLGSYGGGGLYSVDGAGTGTSSLAMLDCTVSGNSSHTNGGGLLLQGQAITLTNVTVANNTAVDDGGGIESNGVATVLQNCTITGNKTTSTYFLDGGGGIDSSSNPSGTSSFTIVNSVVAGNTSASNGPDVDGTFASLGNNLVGKKDTSTGFISTDRTGTVAAPLDAKLGALASNGGLTQTSLPQTGSPLIDHGNNSRVPSGVTTDQRGLARIANTTVDIGAVEVQPAVVSNTASIAGTVFSDTDGDGVKDTGEAGISGVVLYNDANNNSVKDTGEATATTDSTGAYKFSSLAAGTYKIRQVLPSGYTQTSPTGGVGQGVTLAAGQASTGKNFGDKPANVNTASVAGTVFGDADADGKYDANEFGLGLWTVFLDTNKDGKLSTGETSTTTDADGLFSFTGLAAGTYTVRVVQRTSTAASTTAALSLTLTSGQAKTGQLFGEKKIA